MSGGGKGGGSAPAAPDPVALAKAQSASNVETAQKQAELNRINQYTSYGSIEWNYDPSRGPESYNVTTKLSPNQQILQTLTETGQGLYGKAAVDQMSKVQGLLSSPMTGQPFADRVSEAGRIASEGLADVTKAGVFTDPTTGQRAWLGNVANQVIDNSIKSTAEPFVDPTTTPRAWLGNVANQVIDNSTKSTAQPFVDPTTGQRMAAGNIAAATANKAYDAAGQPINTDYNSVRQGAIDAANSRLNPQFAQDEESMRARLLASGHAEGSAGWNNAYRTFNQGKNDARMQTLLNAENLAGQSIQQTGALRGIPLNELQQAQGMASNLAATTGALQGQQITGRQVGLGEAERMGALSGNLANMTGALQGQQITGRQVGLGEAERMGALSGNLANMTGALQGQAMNAYRLPIQTASDQAALAGSTANIANMGFQQQMALRNQPLNETAALLSGNMIQTPQAQAVPQTQVAPTDVIGATMGSYNGQLQAYNQQQQAAAANMGGLYGLGGSALMGAGMFFKSDRRLKEDITKVGKTEGGNNVYTYVYKDDPTRTPQTGVMAQEVMKRNPEAVRKMGGFYAVDYAKVA